MIWDALNTFKVQITVYTLLPSVMNEYNCMKCKMNEQIRCKIHLNPLISTKYIQSLLNNSMHHLRIHKKHHKYIFYLFCSAHVPQSRSCPCAVVFLQHSGARCIPGPVRHSRGKPGALNDTQQDPPARPKVQHSRKGSRTCITNPHAYKWSPLSLYKCKQNVQWCTRLQGRSVLK